MIHLIEMEINTTDSKLFMKMKSYSEELTSNMAVRNLINSLSETNNMGRTTIMNHFQTLVINKSHRTKKTNHLFKRNYWTCIRQHISAILTWDNSPLLWDKWCRRQRLTALQTVERSNHLWNSGKSPIPGAHLILCPNPWVSVECTNMQKLNTTLLNNQ